MLKAPVIDGGLVNGYLLPPRRQNDHLWVNLETEKIRSLKEHNLFVLTSIKSQCRAKGVTG